MDQTTLLNTYIQKLVNELTETLKRKILVETENELLKSSLDLANNQLKEALEKLEYIENNKVPGSKKK